MIGYAMAAEHPYAQMWREHRERMANYGAIPPMSASLTSVLSKAASDILTGLAQGKYTTQVAAAEKLISAIPGSGVEIEKALEIFLWINRATAPAGKIVPDGHGGWVPESNSRYDPKTGEFL